MKIYDVKLTFTMVREDGAPVTASKAAEVVQYMADAFADHPEQESFWVLLLTRKNAIKGRHMVSLGSQTACVAHAREVYRAAVMHGAAAVIVVHNHPSGDPVPSAADLQVTRQLKAAGQALDIQMLDHVIIGDVGSDPLKRGYYSFRESGVV